MATGAALAHLLLFVGRRAADPLVAAKDRYLARLARLAAATEVLIRPAGRLAEGRRMMAQLEATTTLLVLDPAAPACSSPALAARLEALRAGGQRRLAWAVGGAEGLAEAVLARANTRLGLGPMTLPHRLAQVVLVEQLYRAHALMAKLPYHHG